MDEAGWHARRAAAKVCTPLHSHLGTAQLFHPMKAARQYEHPVRGQDGKFAPVERAGPANDGWSRPDQYSVPQKKPAVREDERSRSLSLATPPRPNEQQDRRPRTTERPVPPPLNLSQINNAPGALQTPWFSEHQIPTPTLMTNQDVAALAPTPSPLPQETPSAPSRVKMIPHLQFMCGPLLRYDTMIQGVWYGACMIVSEYAFPPLEV